MRERLGMRSQTSKARNSLTGPVGVYPARRLGWSWSGLLILMSVLSLLMVLVLATLVSSYLGLRSAWRVGRIATRTPWPTFTPALMATPQAVAQVPADSTAVLVVVAPTSQAPADTPAQVTPALAVPTATVQVLAFTPEPTVPAIGDRQAAALAASPLPSPAPTATATSPPQPPPPSPPAADSSPVAEEDWSFAGTRVETQPARKLMLVFGELVNHTGTNQRLSQVTASFFDGQGNVLMADKVTTGLWPTRVIAAGEQVPFALTIRGVVDAASFELSVDAQAVDDSPRQDFEFLGITERSVGSQYCLTGGLQNPEAETARSVVVAAMLYDSQGNLLRFGTDVVSVVEAGQKVDFEVCLNSLPENPARYEVRAWGS